MAVRVSSASAASTTAGLSQKSITRVVEEPPVWVRNPSWPACDANPGDQKMVMLTAVYDGRTPTGSNFLAFVVDGGDFTVNFGDGTTTNYTAGTQVNYTYSFNSAALAGTNAPVTLTASTDTVDRTAHGYTNGMLVTLYNVTSTPEVSSGQVYYVVNATTNTFQISATSGGSPILFSVDGTATLLPYKIATVTVTPQAGQSITSINLDRRHNTIPSTSYSTNLLDVCIAFSTLTTITPYTSGLVFHRSIERFRLLQASTSGTISLASLCREMSSLQTATISPTNANSTADMFSGCAGLAYAPEMSLSSVTLASGMFQNCRSLYYVPSYTLPLCTSFSNMFNNCISLRTVGTITGSSSGSLTAANMFSGAGIVVAPVILGRVTNCTAMFNNCYALTDVPLFDTSLCANFDSMFNNCTALETAPFLNTQSATAMTFMFNGCRALKTVPRYNTQAVTNMSSMFVTCSSLEEVPLFNTQNVTSMNQLFNGCTALRKVPLFNTQSVTNMGNMFTGCSDLTSVPLFNTQSVTTMSGMFQNCLSLTSVPLFNMSRNVTITNMFNGCWSLKTVPQFDLRFCSALNAMFSGCLALETVPAFNLSAAINASAMFQNCTALTSVPGFTTSPTALTNVASMFISCGAIGQIGPINMAAGTSATSFSQVFQSCSSLSRVQAFGMKYSFSVANALLSKGALEELFDNMGTAISGTVTITGNVGIGDSVVSGSCTSTAGGTVVTTANTTGVVAGMLAVGTNCPITTSVTASADPTTDVLTRTAHGLTNGKKFSFVSLGSVTGIGNYAIYYVINATTDTFQFSTTVGGPPVNMGGSASSVTIRYPNYVVSVNPGVSITLDAPQATSGTTTITFRSLDIASALLKNWGVTF